jgi:hypothetical protein
MLVIIPATRCLQENVRSVTLKWGNRNSRREGDAGDGVEVGELGEDEVAGGEDHDSAGELDVLAFVVADHVVELLQRLASGDHEDDVPAHLDDELLRHNDPQPQLLTKRVLPKLVVPVEPLPRHHLVHLHHLPHRVQGDDPR